MSADTASSHGGQPQILRKQDWAYLRIRDGILTGEYPQGGRLDEVKLAEEMNLSRVPVRDALSRLASEGLVIDTPHKRRIVAQMSLQDAEDIYAGRVSLEVTLGRAACQRATAEDHDRVRRVLTEQRGVETDHLQEARRLDREFHSAMYAAAGLPRTLAALGQLRVLSERYIHLYMASPDRRRASLADHEELLAAFQHGDPDTLAALVEKHVMEGIGALRPILAAS
ncbi:GntR family transcriptional regulator [Arthrobacter sp. MW3 TE3886]|uniref:GntR family transcriptional regulator n=1 Tax=Arthrobacter sp. MW3 TE3886 TaxID=3156254 RepID=UPI003519ABE7